MATLRTAFLERINFAKNPFFTTAVNLQPFAQPAPNTDDIKKESKGTAVMEVPSSPKYLNKMRENNLKD